MKCPNCGQEQTVAADECLACGIIFAKWKARQEREQFPPPAEHFPPPTMRAGIEPIAPALPISRVSLNVMAFIGLFIFGWLIAVVFQKLGRAGLGWAYLIPIMGLGTAARQADVSFVFAAVGLYVIAWIHANIILSSYQR